jgi:hypothetical protein
MQNYSGIFTQYNDIYTNISKNITHLVGIDILL